MFNFELLIIVESSLTHIMTANANHFLNKNSRKGITRNVIKS